MATRSPRGFGQYSGVARAVERVGERWALLIVRDLLGGARRYSDLKASLPRIPTNILSDRLRELGDAGVIRRVPTVRGGYELTELGRGLEPVLTALEHWGFGLLGKQGEAEVVSADALAFTLRTAFRPDAAEALPPTRYLLSVLSVGPSPAAVTVAATVVGRTLDVAPVGPGALPQPRRSTHEPVPASVLSLEVAPDDLRALLAGTTGPDGAADSELLERFTATFRLGEGAVEG